MFLRKERTLGEVIPPFYYGLAYENWTRPVSVFYPIPINYFVRWGMAVHHCWNRFRSRPSWLDKQIEYGIRTEVMRKSKEISNNYSRNMLKGMFRFITKLRNAIGNGCEILCTINEDSLVIVVGVNYREERLAYKFQVSLQQIESTEDEWVLINRYAESAIKGMKEVIKKIELEKGKK